MSMSLNRITYNNNNNNNNRTIGSSGSQACAACKYQRRKCAPDCVLAPYFPHDKQRQFLNAHKLFGVSNITKIIKNMKPPEKDIAMRTIVYQSDVRAKDPVGGCYRIIVLLQLQIEREKAELDFVLGQIAVCRAHQAAAYHQQQQQNLQEYNNHQSFYDQEYVNAQKQERFDDDDDDDNDDDGATHDHDHHRDQDLQFSWELQESIWIQSKGSCTEGSPLEGGGDDRVGELKDATDQSVVLVHDHLKMAEFEKAEFVKFDPQQASEKSEMILKVENVTFEGEEAAFEHPIAENDLRSTDNMFSTLTS